MPSVRLPVKPGALAKDVIAAVGVPVKPPAETLSMTFTPVPAMIASPVLPLMFVPLLAVLLIVTLPVVTRN